MRAAFQLFRPPKLRHPWPHLGTLAEKVGAMGGGGQKAGARAARRSPQVLPRGGLRELLDNQHSHCSA